MTQRILSAALIALLSLPAWAQTFPGRSETPITDDADLLSPVAEAELAEKLIALKQDWSVDVAVVTLLSGGLYTAGEDVDAYGDRLAADWDLDGPTEGRSVLLLVIAEDRDLYLRAGPGLSGTFDDAARQAVLDDAILPAFRDGDMAEGIEPGSRRSSPGSAARTRFRPTPRPTRCRTRRPWPWQTRPPGPPHPRTRAVATAC